ncbi:peroxidase family protein [Promicromonospora sp. NPDC050249]|uniref:peroxidase family protein n=1 Tax=Promicromonospora sp. NPDC050249 TaxID=3154743 RepID=UPI0033EF4170
MAQTTEAPPQGEPNHAPHEAVDLAQTPAGRTVRRIGHGGVFVPADPDDTAEPHESTATLMPRTEAAVRRDLREDRFDATTSFDYLLSGLAGSYPEGHLPVGGGRLNETRDALLRLGAAMIEPAAAPGPLDATVPAVYTYWGQFIDHDITLNTNGPDDGSGPGGDKALGDVVSDPFRVFRPKTVVRSLHNGRVPLLDLDSLYGSGPRFEGEKDRGTTRSEAAYVPNSAKLRLGRVSTEPLGPFSLVAPGDDPQRDLPRSTEPGSERMPLIPDSRNDENLVVAQFHVAMIRFHNATVDWVARHEPWSATTQRELFDRAQQLVRYHYQWLVVHDYLRTLTKPGVLDAVLATDRGCSGPRAACRCRWSSRWRRSGSDTRWCAAPTTTTSTSRGTVPAGRRRWTSSSSSRATGVCRRAPRTRCPRCRRTGPSSGRGSPTRVTRPRSARPARSTRSWRTAWVTC